MFSVLIEVAGAKKYSGQQISGQFNKQQEKSQRRQKANKQTNKNLQPC